jgi:TATA-binding protein-associated factor
LAINASFACAAWGGDAQAMDRAHRLGQRRTVNVYRLLMRDTLEERIMGMQRFKLDIAAAVVNADNVSLRNMDTGQLLGLFGSAEDKGKAAPAAGSQEAAAEATAAAGGKGLKAVLAGLEELWDESQYAEEFSLDGFMGKLQNKAAPPQ